MREVTVHSVDDGLIVGCVLRRAEGVETSLVRGRQRQGPLVMRVVEVEASAASTDEWLEAQLGLMESIRSLNVAPVTSIRLPHNRRGVVRRYVPGPNLAEWASRQHHHGHPQLSVLRQLVTAIRDLHRQGVVHGGIHERNIFVSGPANRLVLVDGVITRQQITVSTRPRRESGPWSLVSPMGFERDVRQVLRLILDCLVLWNGSPCSKKDEDLPSLKDRFCLPEDFCKVVLDPACHDGPVPPISVILDAFDGALIPGSDVTPGGRCDKDLGRLRQANEMSVLRSVLDEPARPGGGLACLIGPSGTGKTSLLEGLADYAASRDIPVLKARGARHAEARPLGALHEPLGRLADLLLARAGAAKRLAIAIGAHLPALVDLVPELAFLDPDSPRDDVPTAFTEGQLREAVVAFVQQSVRELGKALLTFDQYHVADEASRLVLRELMTGKVRDPGLFPGLTIVTALQPLALSETSSWPSAVRRLGLRSFDGEQLQNLLHESVGRVSPRTRDYLVDWAGGRPDTALSLTSTMIECGLLTLVGAEWRLSDADTATHESWVGLGMPEDPTQFSAAQLSAELPAECLRALSQAATFGRTFSLDALSRALQSRESEAELMLLPAVAQGLVRAARDVATAFEFSREDVYDVVRALPDARTRQSLHLRAATVLSTDVALVDDYAVAHHFAEAGLPDCALPHAVRAGERALRQGFLDAAQTQFTLAALGLAETSDPAPALELRVREGQGHAHMLQGRYDLAREHFLVAYEKATFLSRLDQARLAVLLAELAFKDGDFAAAALWRVPAFDALGIAFPTNRVGVAARLAGDLVRLAWPSWCRRKRTETDRTRESIKCQLYTRLTYEYWFSRSRLWVYFVCLRGLLAARRSRGTQERAYAYSGLAVVVAGFFPIASRRALRWSETSLAVRAQAGQPWGHGQALHFHGFVLQCSSRYNEAIQSLDLAIEQFSEAGDLWEGLAASWQKSLCLFRLGRLEEARSLARTTYEAAKRVGDQTAAGTSLAIWTRIDDAEVTLRLLQEELDCVGAADVHTRGLLVAAQGWHQFRHGELGAAAESLQASSTMLRAAGIRNHFVAQVETWHLQVLRAWHDSTPPWRPGERRARLRRAQLQLRRSMVVALAFPAERPTVLREAAVISSVRGRPRRAARLLSSARRIALQQACDAEVRECDAVRAALEIHQPWVVDAASAARTASDNMRGIVHAHASHRGAALAEPLDWLESFRALTRMLSASQDDLMSELSALIYRMTPARAVSFHDVSRPAQSEVARSGDSVGITADCLSLPLGCTRSGMTVVTCEFARGQLRSWTPVVQGLVELADAVLDHASRGQESVEVLVAVQEAERDKIARDLHDEFGSIFTRIHNDAMQLSQLPEPTAHQIGRGLVDIAAAGISSTRRAAWGLRPTGMEHLGLLGCLEDFVVDFGRRSAVAVQFSADEGAWPSLSADVETAIFRIVQEAVVNVGRHSEATELSVLLVHNGGSIRAIVEDNGHGFRICEPRTSLGITGMEERAALIGGTVTFESTTQAGTTVVVDIPLSS